MVAFAHAERFRKDARRSRSKEALRLARSPYLEPPRGPLQPVAATARRRRRQQEQEGGVGCKQKQQQMQAQTQHAEEAAATRRASSLPPVRGASPDRRPAVAVAPSGRRAAVGRTRDPRKELALERRVAALEAKLSEAESALRRFHTTEEEAQSQVRACTRTATATPHRTTVLPYYSISRIPDYSYFIAAGCGGGRGVPGEKGWRPGTCVSCRGRSGRRPCGACAVAWRYFRSTSSRSSWPRACMLACPSCTRLYRERIDVWRGGLSKLIGCWHARMHARWRPRRGSSSWAGSGSVPRGGPGAFPRRLPRSATRTSRQQTRPRLRRRRMTRSRILLRV